MKSVSILVDHGPIEFLRRAKANLQRKFGTPAYWQARVQGERRVKIGQYTVFLGVSSYHGDYGEIRFFEANEVDEMTDMLREMNDTDIFLDIGGNIGIHSLFAENVVSKVYTIEPHPVNNAHLLANVERNAANIDLYQCAFSDSREYIRLLGERGGLEADGSVSLSDGHTSNGKSSSQIFTRTERGDDFIQKHGLKQPTVVKIDVEGAEKLVIDGLSQTLKHPSCRLVYCEVHEREIEYTAIAERLESLGFDITVIDERDYGQTIKAQKDNS